MRGVGMRGCEWRFGREGKEGRLREGGIRLVQESGVL